MMTEQQKRRQKKRVDNVTWPEWRKAIDQLTLDISCLLHGHIEVDNLGVKHVVGGNTLYGAHCQYERGGEALYDYETTIVSKLINCECEWKPELSLTEQLKEIASHVIQDEVEKYVRRKAREERTGIRTVPISLDVRWMGRVDDYTGEETEVMVAENDWNSEEGEPGNGEGRDTDYLDGTLTENDCTRITSLVFGASDKADEEKLWDQLYEAANGEPELEWFLKMYEPDRSEELGEAAQHMTARERDRLVKKLRRRVNKKIKDNGKKENRQHKRR